MSEPDYEGNARRMVDAMVGRQAMVYPQEHVDLLVKRIKEQDEAYLNLNEFLRRSHQGLMLLHDRADLRDAAGLRVGDYMADAVPALVRWLDALRVAAKGVIDNPPCSEPDCCPRAKANSKARMALRAALELKGEKLT